jgi:hypothetical protein
MSYGNGPRKDISSRKIMFLYVFAVYLTTLSAAPNAWRRMTGWRRIILWSDGEEGGHGLTEVLH